MITKIERVDHETLRLPGAIHVTLIGDSDRDFSSYDVTRNDKDADAILMVGIDEEEERRAPLTFCLVLSVPATELVDACKGDTVQLGLVCFITELEAALREAKKIGKEMETVRQSNLSRSKSATV